MKEYMGDGVYAAHDSARDAVIVTTENGIAVTATIVLDCDTWQALKAFVKRTMEL